MNPPDHLTSPGSTEQGSAASGSGGQRTLEGDRLNGPASTSSRSTRVLGAVLLCLVALLVITGLITSPADAVQGEAVRLFYVHVPASIVMFIAVGVAALGAVLVLWRGSVFWDLVSAASAEIALVMTGLSLLTGMLWGKPTWGVFWVWDARLTSTALLFILLLGYQAVRALPADRDSRARRSAVAALVTSVNVPIVHYSVDWWRSLHQPATISTLSPKISDEMLFSFFVGMITYVVGYAWLLIHRFRLGWLADRADDLGLDAALAERRAEDAGAGFRASSPGGSR